METFLTKLALGDKFRIPTAEFGKPGTFASAARAQEIFDQSTQYATASINSEVLAIQALAVTTNHHNVVTSLAAQVETLHANNTAVKTSAMIAAASTTANAAVVNNEYTRTMLMSADSNAVLATRLESVMGNLARARAQITPFALTLERFGIINTNIGKSIKDWNFLSVMRSPGILVKALDQLKKTFGGINPEIRKLTYSIQNLAVPALAALGVELQKGNKFAQEFGEQVIKIADDIQDLGKPTKTAARSIMDLFTSPLKSGSKALRNFANELRTSVDANERMTQRLKGIFDTSKWKQFGKGLIDWGAWKKLN